MNARRVCMLAAVILCSGSLLIASAADKPQAKVGPTSVKDVMVSGPSNLAQTSATPDLTANTAGIPAKAAPSNIGGANPRLVDTNQGTQVPWTPATPSHGFAYGARGVGFDGSPGTDAPPALLSGFPMTPFPTDARPVGTEVTDIPVPAPCSGVIAIDSAIPITRRAIGSGWNSWSHGYTGDVYTFYEDPGTVTLTMPEDVCGLYFYVEPNTYDVFDVTCIANLGLATEVSSGPLPADGQGGAIYFGFFASAPDHIETITITVDTAANGWAVGEFGIVCGDECVVAPVACCFESTATCHDQYDLTQCIAEGGRYELGVEFCADMDPACGALIGACCAGPDAELYEPWECIGDMTQVECYALPEEDTNWTYGESCAGSPPFDCNAPTYCDVTYTNCGDRTVCEMGGAPDDWIMNVTFAEINNTTDTEPCPDSYGDYTDQVAYVAYGVTYNLSVQFCSEGAYTQYVTAWIDWNGDKTFDEETERYDLGSGVDATLTMDITVPPTAMPGYTRMRVIEEYNSAPDDACAGATYGETEDYTLLISGDIPVGSCCDPYTGICADNVAVTCCPDGHDWSMDSCADRVPACGNPGACCDITTGECQDGVLELLCEGGRFEGGEECEELEPPCGTPGACCYDEEQALCDIRFEANCDGRFLAGATCDPEEWEALGYPACGDWTCSGILYAPSNADNAAFRDEIAALLGGGQVCDYWDSSASTPTLEDLQDYCCVFVWGNYAFADAVAYGDVLADYVDAGGKVMLGQWCIETTQNNWLEGRIMTEAYCPVTATGYGADSYVDGSGSSPVFMDVHTLEGDYFDQCTALPSALSDGLLAGGNIAAAWRPDNAVYYLPGAAAPDLTSGDLAQLIVNACAWGGEPAYGACCDPTTGTCTDDVLFTECDGQFVMNGTCADDFPNCGDRGACCNPYDGTCTDEVLALDCPAGYRHEPGEECEELEPICGTPGACCDEDAALCTIEFQANCAGRFIAGATCDPDPWEALGQPACGDWECEGLLYAPSNADDAALRADIAAIAGCAVDYYDPRAGTPTLADIQDYCAIYTWVNYAYSDTVGFGDVLADFVDGGGKVILGQWCVYTGQNNWLEGRIMTESYCPITASSRGAGSYVDGSGTDCIFCNFHSLTGDYFDYCTAIAGAMFDGELNTGDLAAAWRADRRVYYVPGATPLNTGDLAQLIANIYGCVGSSAIGACCDPATGVCTDGVDCASCDGQFAIGGTCADDFPNCGNPGACCDDSAAVCTTEFEVNCPPGHRFLAGVACDPDPWEALGLDACGDYDACEHSITLWDDYGDGWNGNYIDVYVDGALILEGVTIASGAGPETVNFDAGTGSVIETVYTFDPGMWPYENSYCIYSGVGEELICDGMDGVDPTGVTTTGNCEAGICGDGACGVGEDVCNCPEDCGAYECPTQAPNAGNGIFSDIGCDSCTGGAGGLQVLAENFFVCDGDEIEIDAIGFWGGYYPNNTVLDPDLFTVIIKADDGAAAPGTAIATFGPMAATTKAATGVSLFGVDEYAYTIDLDPNVTLTGGTYWIEIYNDTSSMTDDWFWEAGDLDTVSGIIGQAFSFTIPEEPWSYDSATDMAIDVICVSGKMSPKADPRLDSFRKSRRTLDAAPVVESPLEAGASRR